MTGLAELTKFAGTKSAKSLISSIFVAIEAADIAKYCDGYLSSGKSSFVQAAIIAPIKSSFMVTLRAFDFRLSVVRSIGPLILYDRFPTGLPRPEFLIASCCFLSAIRILNHSNHLVKTSHVDKGPRVGHGTGFSLQPSRP